MDARYKHPLFDYIREAKNLDSDMSLAMATGIPQAAISKIRRGKAELSDSMRVMLMRRIGLSIKKIDALTPPEA